MNFIVRLMKGCISISDYSCISKRGIVLPLQILRQARKHSSVVIVDFT